MTRQEIFDKVYLEISKQGPSKDEATLECKYRGPEGRRCAVGLFMPDDVYCPAFEGRSVKVLPEMIRLSLPHGEDEDFWVLLQGAHDHAANPHYDPEERGFGTNFRELMQIVAEEHGLDDGVTRQ